ICRRGELGRYLRRLLSGGDYGAVRVEKPRSRAAVKSIAARPSAPLWVAMPIRPGSGHERPEGCIQRRARIGIDRTDAVRADEPHPIRSAHLHELRLTLLPIRADFAKARCEYDQGVHALATALLGDAKHVLRRDRDNSH